MQMYERMLSGDSWLKCGCIVEHPTQSLLYRIHTPKTTKRTNKQATRSNVTLA